MGRSRSILLCKAVLIAAGLLGAGSAAALEFRNLNDNAVVYDGASRQATPQFILLRGTPVEVIVAVEKWVKIREVTGGIGWVERTQLADPKLVIVTQAQTIVRAQPDETSPAAFSADKDVLLEIVEKPGKAWLKVKHKDGAAGYVSIKAVWGH
jgi:SH3-like domain-containing protein